MDHRVAAPRQPIYLRHIVKLDGNDGFSGECKLFWKMCSSNFASVRKLAATLNRRGLRLLSLAIPGGICRGPGAGPKWVGIR